MRSIGFHEMGLGEASSTKAWRLLSELTDSECERIAAAMEQDKIDNHPYSFNGEPDYGPYNEDDE